MRHFFAAFPLFIVAASDQDPQGKGAPAQGRVDPPAVLESWYQVTKGDRHVGWMWEELARGTGGVRYEYRLEMEIHRAEGDTSFHARAALDDTYTPGRFRVVVDGRARTAEIPGGEAAYGLPSLMLYSMWHSEMFARPGRHEARLLDFRSGEALAGVAFEVSRPARRKFLGRENWVTPVRFLKSPPAPRAGEELSELFIDRYGRIVESSLRDGTKFTLVARERDATGDLLRGMNRRDPFLRGASTREPAAELPPRLFVSPDELASRLSQAWKDLRDLKLRVQIGELAGSALAERGRPLLQLWKAMYDTAYCHRRDLVPDVARFRDELEAVWPAAGLTVRAARGAYVRALVSLDREDFPPAEAAARELSALRGGLELAERDEYADVCHMESTLERELAKARVRHELASKKLEVTGITIALREAVETVEVRTPVEVRLFKDASFAAINGQTVRVGDQIEGVTVEKIRRNGVQVSFKGETRELPLGTR